ncbi:uncharacterized protein L3040_003624 [Drepanopeziza brunnea f. sp. 'multigermtubi']|uniref:uncharacterized protein n=1 Tax=Drepanopeziza brunnea f. sp. 'multigermtubi' TaxID=698441 RepID=UPI002397A860|nr:hypothetical protein L3040_003624 [Drepanopeziza brunnea f. sp. 'multigermtubi']
MPRGGVEERVVDRPLPPLPSQFRLGEDDLPWTTEPWLLEYPESDCASPPPLVWRADEQLEDGRREDPQRVGTLAELQQAMLTVDSLSQARSGWAPWTLETAEEDVSRGPMGLGWATRSDEHGRTWFPLSYRPILHAREASSRVLEAS